MRKQCKDLLNFDKNLHSGDLNFSKVKGDTLEEVLVNVETALEGVPFSVSLDTSGNVETYANSIDQLIDTIIEELNKEELPIPIDQKAKNQIREHFQSKFLPKPLTKTDKNIQAVIKETDLITEDERRSLRLGETLREIYGGNEIINTFRQNHFEEAMRVKTIIDTKNRKIVRSQKDLNDAIVAYQNEQYKILRDFVVKLGFDSSLLPQTMYNTKPKLRLHRNYTNALQMMYNFIQSEKAKGTFNDNLEQSWENVASGDGDFELYRAVSAYVNLSYFDDILFESFGDYIGTNQNQDMPITEDQNRNITFKYSFERGNANTVHTWGEQDRDALKEMSKFQQVLIKGITLYSYDSESRVGTAQDIPLQPKDFVGAFSKLLDIGSQIKINKKEVGNIFAKAIQNFQDRNQNSLRIIFEELFKNPDNKTLLKQLNDLGLDSNAISYLYSVYKTVFDGKNSWKAIEDEDIKKRGLDSQHYPLINTLLGAIDSNVSMNYANTTFNHDNNEIETKVKAKYSTSRTKFDIVNSVNATTIDRNNKQEILDQFKIEPDSNKKDYTITLNSASISIKPTNNTGLLDKTDKSNKITVIGLPTEVDLSNHNINKLLSKQGLDDNEQLFVQVLDFIDTMLGTYFSRDVDEMKELRMLLQINKDNLKEMFLSASRGLLVTNIYNNFKSTKKPNGDNYQRTELLEYLRNSDAYAHKIQDMKNKKQYFIERFDGWQLNTLRSNQRWIDDLAKVRAIMMGDTSKSVISNLEGKKLPNYGPGFLGARIEQQLTRSNRNNQASAHLLFVKNPSSIKAKVVNADVITKDGIKKQVKNMSQGELLYDAIVNKFLVPYLDDKTVYTQPTTYSDKTKFILYQVSLEALGITELHGNSFNRKVEQLIIETIGESYKSVLKRVKDDYLKLFPTFIKDGELDIDLVQNWLKTHTEQDLITKAKEVGITVYKDVHYRQVQGKRLSVNELLFEYAENLYTPENLHRRLEREKISFINDLLANRVSFQVSLNEKGEPDITSGDVVTKMLVDILGSTEAKRWIKGNKLIIAKTKNRNITYGKVSENEEVEINPVLNAFFMLDNLIGNNLRFSLTGSEINHKVKELANLDLGAKGMNLHKAFIKKYNPNYDNKNITFYDAMVALKNYNGEESDLASANSVRTIYNEQIYKIENAAQNAQFKRNVIIPGTLRYYLQGTLNGIRDRMKIAVINDIGAKVFNFDGKSDSIDAHDGSAFVNPFSSILENLSLQDNEVGTIKKPIQHWYDDRYMSATLLKYAVDTITNRWMLQSEGNDPRNKHHGIVLRNVFKKMTNVRWHNSDDSWKFGEIDLINGCEFKDDTAIDFQENIVEGKQLYYTDGYKSRIIKDFGIENGIYYTIEQDVDSTGNIADGTEEQKVYHYFNNASEHITSLELLNDPSLHTIDSLFELHTALGGIYSQSLDENGQLQQSEASNFAVAQFINHVATLRPGKTRDSAELTQEYYYQPLKEAMIDVLANNSAVKNGAGNINPTTSFYDDTEFLYMEVETNGYGIQMDADHEADEAHMTEFSQVISSLDAGGRMHGYVSQIYESLGKLALDLSEIELDAVKEFRQTGNISKIYDIVGRTIMNNLSKNKGQAGLANAIIESIKQEFNLNTDHELDNFKIPFSDPNIYSTILATFVSVINKKSIKRQYPGLGAVMVPGYNLSMIYDIDGKTYQYEDLLKIAISQGFTSQYTDISKRNRDIVQQFLQAKQSEMPVYTHTEMFQPTDNVIINCVGEVFNLNTLNSDNVEWDLSDNSIDVYIKGNRSLGSVKLIKETEYQNYSIQFNIEDIIADPNGLTPKERRTLFNQIYALIPEGAFVTLSGKVSDDNLQNIDTLMDEYFQGEKVGNIAGLRNVTDSEENIIQVPIYQKFGTGMMSYENSLNHSFEISLNGIEDYYLFKNDINTLLREKGIINTSKIEYQKNITVPRNLAPVKISWQYDIKVGDQIESHNMNIFDHWRIKELYQTLAEISNNKSLSKSDKKLKEMQARKKYNVQQAFDEIAKGIYVDKNGIEHQIYHIDSNGTRVNAAINQAAELIMSNLYKSKFGLQNGDTLADVRDAGENYFIKYVTPLESDNYDIVYTKQSNENLYITFKPIQQNDENFDSTRRKWSNKIKKNYEYPKDYKGEKTIIHEVYATDRDNIPLFKVGREILRNDVQYDTVKKKFVYKSGKKVNQIVRNQSRFIRYGEDQVLEYVEFVSNFRISENIGEKQSKYNLYNINRQNIKKCLYQQEYTEEQLTRVDKKTNTTYKITPEQKFDEEVNTFISKLLADIYHTQDFNGMQLNSKVTVESHKVISSVLHNLGNHLKYDSDLKSYIQDGILNDLMTNPSIKEGKVYYSPRTRSRILNEYHEKLGRKQYYSFLKSQEFTASRIPAQTLQSFMQMRNVGFTGTSNNQCFVSHWQEWLQGSDFDIDKAYIMGLSFDGNGKYVGWSNLFKYSSVEAIKASEYLPMPKKKIYNVRANGENIDRFITEINDAKNDVEEVNGYVKLLNYLNDNNITEISYASKEKLEAMQQKIDQELKLMKQKVDVLKYLFDSSYRRSVDNIWNDQLHSLPTLVQLQGMVKVVQAIMDHEFTIIPKSLQEDASKNFVSSHIQNTVQNLRNMIGAYSPIEMEDFRTASERSPKGEQSSKMTLFNPATKLLMQYQNITGKNVIGIAANGEKASFMWHYYLNDVLRNPTDEKIKYSQFSIETNRIAGRDSGNIHFQEVNTLPDVNFEEVDPELMARYGVQLTGDITVDLMISQILSAATDNAKELILAKVNAGTKLAKMYLFLVTLGFNINDIVKFMTSPAVSFIDTITETNIFTGQDITIKEAIKLAKGDFTNFYKKFLSTRTLGRINKTLRDKLNKGEIIENGFRVGSQEYNELENALDAISEMKYLLQKSIEESKQEYSTEEMLADINEFENILEGAEEFSNLGRILGANQGLPTSKADLQNFVQFIQSILANRIKAYNDKQTKENQIEVPPLDVKRYLTDVEYAKDIKDLYNKVKKCVNIFDVIDHIPQFNAIFKIFSGVMEIDHNISIKTRAYDFVYDQLKAEGRYMSEDYQKHLLKGIDDAIIAKFINNSRIEIPYAKGSKLLNELRQVVEVKEDHTLTFDSLSDVASFKHLMENTIIPNLKEGIYYDKQGGKIVRMVDPSIKNNRFIQSLIKADSKGMPLYKCDLDMLTIDNSTNSRLKFQKYIKGLQALQKTKINGMPLSDLFVLYNLVVNKNQYGSDRMTTLFDSFIQNNGQLSLIKKYLNYVGKLDYSGKVEELNINILDLMKAAAAIVNSDVNQKDPTIIVNTDAGPELRIKAGYNYTKWEDIVPRVPGETQDETLQRIYNHNSYFVLGGSYSDAVDRQIQNIRVITSQTLDNINELIRQGTLNIYKVCK